MFSTLNYIIYHKSYNILYTTVNENIEIVLSNRYEFAKVKYIKAKDVLEQGGVEKKLTTRKIFDYKIYPFYFTLLSQLVLNF